MFRFLAEAQHLHANDLDSILLAASSLAPSPAEKLERMFPEQRTLINCV